jgi:hypothetical protein
MLEGVRCHFVRFIPVFNKIRIFNVGFDVLTAVVMKSTMLSDISPCSPLKLTKVSEKHVSSIHACHMLSRWFFSRLILQR